MAIAQGRYEEINRACPLVGVVDNPPPCALNGNTPAEDKTAFTFTYTDVSSKTVMQSWKVGAFVTKGGPSGYLAGDIHAGLQRLWSETTITTKGVTHDYKPEYVPGKISAIHSVSTTIAREFEAWREGNKVPNLDKIVVIEVVGTSLLEIAIDPPYKEAMVLRHTVGALESYGHATYEPYDHKTNNGNRRQGHDHTVFLGDSKTTSETKGYYLSVKLGGRFRQSFLSDMKANSSGMSRPKRPLQTTGA